MSDLSSATTTGFDQPFVENGNSPSANRKDLKKPDVHGELPAYGRAYLFQLIGEFKSICDICANEKAKVLGQELVNRAEDGDTMTWGDAYMLDTAIAQMLPVEYLHQRAWCLEVKYRDAVGNADAYDAFLKIESAHLENEKEEHLRARVHNLIRELYRLYTVISCRGDMREELSKSALKTLAIVFILMGVLLATDYWIDKFRGPMHSIDILFMVFTAGATGGLLSLQRRLQSLPSYGESLSDLVELSGRMTVRFTPIIGGVFAIVLLLIFASGLAKGPLFPEMPGSATLHDIRGFIEDLEPASTAEWGKLLVWSFIAGFAERFVPDTLDRLIARSEQSKNKVK